jgi:hypothetical protein
MALATRASMSVEYLEMLMQLTQNWCINLSIQNKSFKPVLKSGLLQVVVTFGAQPNPAVHTELSYILSYINGDTRLLRVACKRSNVPFFAANIFD